MTRRLTHFSAVALRWLAIALLLAIPVGSDIAWTVGMAKHDWVQVFGGNVVGEVRVYYMVESGAITFDYYRGWVHARPRQGELYNLPGLDVSQSVLPLTGQTRGYVELLFRVRWWLLILANISLILLALRLARPTRRRRSAPGRCPVCGYDLRATPERCPECGTATVLEAK